MWSDPEAAQVVLSSAVPTSVPAGSCRARSARRAAEAGPMAGRLLLMSPPEVVSAAGEGAADKEERRDRRARGPVPGTPLRNRVTEPLPGAAAAAGDPSSGACPCRFDGAP
ncbi:hypothetical protein [Blastococcus sp. KM273129]|uniref:hypothetical protein n=1 Tax=Blastococcus sp. KM273129 TaxID=2570315 RepID=UPI001F1C4950|nr:hypothetical protein [Blastococcus sp. KM273129]